MTFLHLMTHSDDYSEDWWGGGGGILTMSVSDTGPKLVT